MSTEKTIRSKLLSRMCSPAHQRFGTHYMQQLGQQLGCTTTQAWEAMWGLVGDGLVYLDPAGQPGSDNWLWVISERGVEVAQGGAWEPRDYDGYLARIRSTIPDLNPLAYRYVEESVKAFNARCFLASSVMLGVASEAVFNDLADAFIVAVGDGVETLAKYMRDPSRTYHSRFAELRKRLEPRREHLPEHLRDSLTLDAVGDLFRITRNSAGHPSDFQIAEDDARVNLQMAGRYLAKMTEMTGALRAFPPGSFGAH